MSQVMKACQGVLLLKIEKPAQEGIIAIPDSAREYLEGTAMNSTDGINAGDRCLYRPGMGKPFKLDGVTYLKIHVHEILVALEEREG